MSGRDLADAAEHTWHRDRSLRCSLELAAARELRGLSILLLVGRLLPHDAVFAPGFCRLCFETFLMMSTVYLGDSNDGNSAVTIMFSSFSNRLWWPLGKQLP